MNEKELELGVPEKASWHAMYKDTSWVFVGGLDHELTEGDVICVFSQYGEIENIHLVRDRTTGKSKGFGFVCYQDQRSTILAVDNLNEAKICGRTIRVDHTNYDWKGIEKLDDESKAIILAGCAPKPIKLDRPGGKPVKR